MEEKPHLSVFLFVICSRVTRVTTGDSKDTAVKI